MAKPDYSDLVAGQREYFLSGSTRPVSWRRAQLEALKAMFAENHDELCDALWTDLRRNVIDADMMDVEYNVREADYALKHLELLDHARTRSYAACASTGPCSRAT